MAHIFMQHQVEDYATWRPHSDADQAARAAAGMRGEGQQLDEFVSIADDRLQLGVGEHAA